MSIDDLSVLLCSLCIVIFVAQFIMALFDIVIFVVGVLLLVYIGKCEPKDAGSYMLKLLKIEETEEEDDEYDDDEDD